ncbi:M81 family metallopeptidase [uncultured Roseibium sp.]|uniref:M81 family metallopeptidase n=1 Tax=uncultured Roseibium sp. TaxID=1936171 RepID=UPI002636DED7|nr:M81 family metallopeptidase [uncultured Roseibium sp.]
MKIAVGGIHTECSTYSPLIQTADDFTIVRGEDLVREAGLADSRYAEIAFQPLFHARSVPGGPVEETCYQSFKGDFLKQLEDSLPVDGVLLIMHGAMHVVGLGDAEGDWIAAVRKVIGPKLPIAVSYDLHGNVTQNIVDQIDIFCAYRTAPHIDVQETHQRAADLLIDQLSGGSKRCVAWVPVPVLHPGERTSTEDEPMKSLYTGLPLFDASDGVDDSNLMVGYVWADTERATASAVVTGTDPAAAKQAAELIAAGYWNNRENCQFGVPTKPLEDCLMDASACKTHPFILADSGDNPTGGGVGDRTDILHLWLEKGMEGGVFAGIADPAAVDAAWQSETGAKFEITIGGAHGSSCPTVECQAKVQLKRGDPDKKTREVLLEVANNLVILSEYRRPFHKLDDFKAFGIDPASAKFLIVKSGYLSPELAPIACPPRMALTDGAVNQDIRALQNEWRRPPSFPFQQDFDWLPTAKLSARAGHKTP